MLAPFNTAWAGRWRKMKLNFASLIIALDVGNKKERRKFILASYVNDVQGDEGKMDRREIATQPAIRDEFSSSLTERKRKSSFQRSLLKTSSLCWCYCCVHEHHRCVAQLDGLWNGIVEIFFIFIIFERKALVERRSVVVERGWNDSTLC